MHDIKERLSVLWIFALLNYLYADVIALWAILGSPPADTPHLGQLALAGSAVLMEIPIAMILASRLLPLRANRLANIIAGSIVTLVNGFLTFIPPLVGWGRPPALPEYLFFATIETVCTADLHSAPGRVGPAARFAGVPVLRNARNRLHRGHRLAGVDLARGGCRGRSDIDRRPAGSWNLLFLTAEAQHWCRHRIRVY